MICLLRGMGAVTLPNMYENVRKLVSRCGGFSNPFMIVFSVAIRLFSVTELRNTNTRPKFGGKL